MRVVDAHVHMRGEAQAPEMLRRLDANGVERMIVISEQERVSLPETRRKLLATKALFDGAPDRLAGLAWLVPLTSTFSNCE